MAKDLASNKNTDENSTSALRIPLCPPLPADWPQDTLQNDRYLDRHTEEHGSESHQLLPRKTSDFFRLALTGKPRQSL